MGKHEKNSHLSRAEKAALVTVLVKLITELVKLTDTLIKRLLE